MDGTRFDAITRGLATSGTRRATVRAIAGGAAAVVGALGLGNADSLEAARCRKLGRKCRKGIRCCGFGRCKRRRCCQPTSFGCKNGQPCCSGVCCNGTCCGKHQICADGGGCGCNTFAGEVRCGYQCCNELAGEHCCNDGRCCTKRQVCDSANGRCKDSGCQAGSFPCQRSDGRIFCCRDDMICCGDAGASCVFDASNCPT